MKPKEYVLLITAFEPFGGEAENALCPATFLSNSMAFCSDKKHGYRCGRYPCSFLVQIFTCTSYSEKDFSVALHRKRSSENSKGNREFGRR